MGKDLIKLMAFLYVVTAIVRTQKDDNIRKEINEIWNNQTEIELTGDETEEQEMEKRKQALEKNTRYQELKKDLEKTYRYTGDLQENIHGIFPFSTIVDLHDWVKDETSTLPENDIIATGWTEVQDDIVSTYEGKLEDINYEVKYKQHMLAARDFRRIVRTKNLNIIDYGDMLRKEGDLENKDIRIVCTYDYTNYYANDKDKIDTSCPVDIEVTDKGVKLTKTIKVYQDSFKAIPSPNVDSEIEKVQFGFIFNDDPLRTYDEFCQVARSAANTNSNRTGTTYEYAKTHNKSKNAVSYFQSDNYYNQHKDSFIDTDNKMIKANNKDAVQTAFALWAREIYLNSNSTIFDPDELKKIRTAYNNTFEGDFSIQSEIIVEVGNCNYEDRNDQTNYKEVNLSKIDWPDNLQDIKEIRDKLPSVGGKAKKKDSKIISESELEKKKQEIISGNADLPEINDGEISGEEEKEYTIYDWNSIEEDLETTKEEEKEEDVGINTNNMKTLSLSNQKQKKYTASKDIPYFLSEDFQSKDIFYIDSNNPDIELEI